MSSGHSIPAEVEPVLVASLVLVTGSVVVGPEVEVIGSEVEVVVGSEVEVVLVEASVVVAALVEVPLPEVEDDSVAGMNAPLGSVQPTSTRATGKERMLAAYRGEARSGGARARERRSDGSILLRGRSSGPACAQIEGPRRGVRT